MTLGKSINKLRTNANMSQEQFADLFGVSQQSVQKWETDAATPELSKLVSIAKYFGVSLDALILGNGNRIVEELKSTKEINPQYQSIADSEFYSSYILNEYQQSLEEGLDIEQYSDLFKAVSHLPKNEIKKKMGDILFSVISGAKQKKDYKYTEPSDLDFIKELRAPYSYNCSGIKNTEKKIKGAWFGRICGCMLGKPIE